MSRYNTLFIWHFSVGVKSIYIKTGDGLLAASLGPSPTLKICDSTHTCCKTGYLDHNGWDRGKPGQIDYYFSGNILSECRQVSLFNVIEKKHFLMFYLLADSVWPLSNMDCPAYENEQIPRPGQMARRLGEDHNNGARGLHLPQGRQAWKHPWSNNIKEHHMCYSR